MPRSAKTKSVKSPLSDLKKRLVVVAVLLGLYGAGLSARLVYLQVLQHEALFAESEKQYLETVEINSGRGLIYDRNHNLLAANIDVESVYLDPREVEDPVRTARILSETLGLSAESARKKLQSKRRFVWVKRKADLGEITQLKQHDLPGLGFIRESRRFYPKRELAASTLGFVGMDNQGLEGIEHYYDHLLKGVSRRKFVERDARGRPLINTEEHLSKPSSPSHDIELTLDEVIQFTAERALARQVEKYDAKGGVAIVMDPSNGDILALATNPQFNPNHYNAFPPPVWRNTAVSHVFEPGSIFKPLVAAATLETGSATPQDIFFCENGRFKIGKSVIGEADDHRFGWLSMSKIIVHSSNIGAIKVAQALGQERFYDYIRRFGFGERLGIDLPGEAPGMLRPLSSWSGLSLASISFGHEISVTPIQMMAAMAAIANGGNLVQPRLARATWKNNQPVKVFQPKTLRKVLSGKTTQQMIGIMKAVVREGTGKKAAVPGFEVAGKTGTAQKIDPETRGYSATDFVASFIGFVPAEAPRLVILVMVDEPKNKYWGGTVAAPAFREIAQQTLRYLNIPSGTERVFVLDRA